MRPARLGASRADFDQIVRCLSERVPALAHGPPSIQKENGNMSLKNRLLQLTLVVLSLAIGMQAQDTQHCSNATLHGSYGFHATGTGFVAIGRFVFDGNG